MSKYTSLKLERLFETIGNKTLRRIKPIQAIERTERQCVACSKVMYVSPGQIVYGHKKCKGVIEEMASYAKSVV